MQTTSQGGGSAVGSGDSWQRALTYSKKLGYIPLAFPVAVRTLVADSKTKEGIIRPVTKYQVARLLRGPNFKAMLYYISDLIARDTVKGSAHLSVGDLMDLYQPLDLAAVLSCYVTHRLALKASPEALTKAIRPTLAHETQVGALVGVAMPSLGLAGGLLWGSARHIAHMIMSSEDPKAYVSWSKAASGKSVKQQAQLELETWGCTSAQVASMLLAAVGLGKEIASLLEQAGSYEGPILSISDPELQKFRLSILWFDCFCNKRELPREKLPAKMFPFDTDRKRVEAAIAALDTSSPSWLERTGADISKEKTPLLFAEAKANGEFEVPEQLKDVFNLDQITGMDEWEFDSLVAHMDREIEETSEEEGVLSQKDLNKLEEMVS